jgi:protein-tyrosine phosphatase
MPGSVLGGGFMGATADPRRLLWDACYNVRDLGGFAVDGARTTRWRAIVRSDNICRLTRHGRQALVRYGIRTVIDLRSPDELLLETDPFSRGDMSEVAYINSALMTPEFLRLYEAGLTQLFEITLLQSCGSALAALFTAIASAPTGGVLVYCHAGKERTGIASALLLALSGVSNELIALEYARSDEYLEPLYAAWIAARPEEERDAMAKGLRFSPSRMLSTLEYVDEEYGGAAEYLRSTGIDERDLARVRHRLAG